MSNPLSMFRKHQYIFLVVFGVMLMVAFIVLPPLDDYLRTQQGPGSNGDPVVVRWRDGQLRETELDRLRQMHLVAVQYLYAVVRETQQREGTPRGVRQGQFGQILDPGIPSTMSDENLVHTHLLAAKGEAMGMVVSDEAIAEFLEQLSDDKIPAKEMGSIFTQNIGGQFSLQQLLNQLRVELMAQRVRSMAEAGLYVSPYGTVQPVQAWDYFKRLNRRVKIEAVALDVNDYVDRVKPPTDAQLQTLYEEGKNRFSFPESPEPGFQIRRKAAFQFVRADFNEFLEEEKAKVTISDEEIEKHYEENKDLRYKAIDLPDSTLGDTTPEDETETPAATDPDAAPAPPKDDPENQDDPAPEPPADDPAKKDDSADTPKPNTPSGDAPEEPKPEEPKPEEPKPEEPKPAEPKPAEPKPAEPKPAEPKPAPDTPAPAADSAPAPDDPAPPTPPGEAKLPTANREFFVTTQGEENQPPGAPTPAPSDPPAAVIDEPAPPAATDPQPEEPVAPTVEPTEPKPAAPKADDPSPEATSTPQTPPADDPAPAPAAEDPPATTPPATTPPATTPPATTPPATTPPATTPPATTPPATTPPATTPPATTPPATTPPTASPAAATPPAEAPTPKLRPLDDDLRQEIREELTEIQARKPAQDRLDKALAELRSLATRLGRAKRNALRASKPDDDDAKPAGPVDVAELAGTHGLTVGQIPLVDAIEIRGTGDDEKPSYDLGDAFNLQYTSWPPTRESFTDIAFEDNVRRYSPSTISGSESGVQFLYWKTDGEEPYVPEFAEARSEIEAAWKLIEARKIAKNEGINLQEQIAKNKVTMKEKFADTDREVIEPPEFSWMTTGFNPSGGGTPELSQIEGIENAGQDLMKAIFSLKVGEVGTALNMPKSKVYVVRVASDSPPETLLRQLFLTIGDSPEIQYIAYVESITLLRAWYSNLETEMGLTWQRDPIDAT